MHLQDEKDESEELDYNDDDEDVDDDWTEEDENKDDSDDAAKVDQHPVFLTTLNTKQSIKTLGSPVKDVAKLKATAKLVAKRYNI